MPRSASQRAFGFRAEGLIRIIEGADPREVKLALEALGLALQDEQGVLRRLLNLVGEALGPFSDLFAVVDTVRDVISAFVTPALDVIVQLTSAKAGLESVRGNIQFALDVIPTLSFGTPTSAAQATRVTEALRVALTSNREAGSFIDLGSDSVSLAVAPAGALLPEVNKLEAELLAGKEAFQARIEEEAKEAVAPSTEFL